MFKKKSVTLVISLLLAAAFILSSCGSSGNQAAPAASPSGSASASTQPSANAGTPAQPSASTAPSASVASPGATKSANKDTLVVGTMGDARVLDPHQSGDSLSNTALYPVVENLLVHDENQNLQPWLAEKWERIDDSHWKFWLRQGVKFHNGEEMTAHDVKFSYQRANSPIGSKVAYIMGLIDAENIEIIDDYTLIIPTVKPFTPFIDYLPYIGATIISEKHYKDNPDAEMHPIGTGPMTFEEWKKGDSLTYKRFDGYWGEKTDFETLIIRAIPEANSRLIELETGGVDIAINMTVNDKVKVEENPNLQWQSTPTTIFTSIYFNCTNAPFDNEAFRQAIDYAVDSQAIVQAVYRGAFSYTPGPVTPHQNYFDDSEANDRFDVAKAKELLAESGVDVKGKVYNLHVNENQSRIDIATIVQNQLKENLGMDVEIKVMESAAYNDFTVGNDPEKQLFIIGWGAVGFPDPDNNIYGPWHSAMIPATNSANFASSELDDMLERSRMVDEGPEREKLIKDIQALIRNATPLITFENPHSMAGMQSYIEGFRVTPTAHQFFTKVKIN